MDKKTLVYIGAGAAAVIIVAYLLKKTADAAVGIVKDTIPYVNPADENNIVNQGVTSIGKTISGDSNWTLGGWVYDATHPGLDPNSGEVNNKFLGLF